MLRARVVIRQDVFWRQAATWTPKHVQNGWLCIEQKAPYKKGRKRKLTVVAWWLDICLVVLRTMFDHQLADRRVCACWVPQYLSDNYKTPYTVLFVSFMHMTRYFTWGDKFLHYVVTGDKTWVHAATLEIRKGILDVETPVIFPSTGIQSNTIRKEDNGDSFGDVKVCCLWISLATLTQWLGVA